jgi:exodeoxyribonuclease-5
MDLSQQQEEAFTLFKEFVDSTEPMFLLTGCAGSGKSFLTRILVEYILNLGKSICVLAPTHKALGVIKGYLGDVDVDYNTIAKFLFKKQTFLDDGQVSFIRDSNLFMKHKYDYLFIDEASMVDADDFHCFNLLRSKTVFIGDSFQLPPVGERNSIVFDHVSYVAKLTETIRTNHNSLQDVYNQFRQYVFNNCELELESSEHVQVYDSKTDFFNSISTNFIGDGSCKIITYRNVMVDMYNQYVRKRLFNTDDLYVPGEQLIFTQNYSEEYTNNTEVVVKSVNLVQEFHPYTKKLYIVNKLILTDDNVLYKIAPQSKKEYDDYFNDMLYDIKRSTAKNKAKKWAKYYQQRQTFDPPIAYSYALTAYKSQGSTITTTFIDLDDIFYSMVDKDELVMKKAMYTSITRASEKLYILI